MSPISNKYNPENDKILGISKLCSSGEFHEKYTDKNSRYTKGQINSKCLLGLIVSTKKQTFFFKDFCPSL